MRIFPVLVTAMLSFTGVYGQNIAMEQQRLYIRQNTKEKKDHPYVRTDEYVELMELIARFADNSVFNNSYAPRYQKDCDTFFAAFKEHPAVEWMRKQLPKYSISYDAVPWLGVHLKWNGTEFSTIPNCNKAYKRWSKSAMKEFLPLLSDFYVKSGFHHFYVVHESMYQAAVNSARDNIGDYIDLDWFEQFFNTKKKVDYGIIVGMNNGAGSFSVERQIPGHNREKISVLLYAENKDGTPCYRSDSEEDRILVHEFCHPYIKAAKKYKKIGTGLLQKYGKKLNSVGYGTWENVIEESLVRVSVIRYMLDHGYSDDVIKREIDKQHNFYGFVWLPKNIEWYKGNVLSLFDELNF